MSIGDQEKVIKDFGLFSLSLFSVLYAVISGAQLLAKELMRKTLYNILSKSVTRTEFIAGKFLGLFLSAALLLLLMAVVLSAFTALFEGKVDLHMGYAYLHILFELFIVCAASIFFSSLVVTPALSGLFAFALFLAGRSAGFLDYFLESEKSNALLEYLIPGLQILLPQLERLSVSDAVVYGASIPVGQVCWSFIYTISYSLVLFLLATILFQRRDFN